MIDTTRAVLLALALESSPLAAARATRFRRRKSVYVAVLVVRPGEYRMLGLVEAGDGIDVLWQNTGRCRIDRSRG